MQKIFKPGDKVNGYTVINYNDKTKEYEFVCDECGTKKIGYYYHLMQVCTHAIDTAYSTLSKTLRSMKSRCFSPKNSSYKDYGGRGITICDEWLKYPKAFQEWSLENGWEPGLQIDRINNDLGYEPNNCRWVSPQVNANNRRSNVYLKVNGIRYSVSEWSRRLNIHKDSISSYMLKHGEQATIERIKKGWLKCGHGKYSHHKYVHSKFLTINGTTLNYKDWGQRLGKCKTHVGRLIRQFGKEEAIRIITSQLNMDITGTIGKYNTLITIQNITDTMCGWSRRIHCGDHYVSRLIKRLGKEEAIRRITEQWEAIKKAEAGKQSNTEGGENS